MNAISLHIGLNHFDPNIYCGDSGRLRACVNDAYAMAGLALNSNFPSVELLLNAKATKDHFLSAMDRAHRVLEPGGIFLLTFSGHGGQANSLVSPGDLDEVWCLYDGIVTDNDLCSCWRRFHKDTRILVVSDSCYSGGILRTEEEGRLAFLNKSMNSAPPRRGVQRMVLPRNPKEVNWKTCKNGQPVNASVRLLSASASDEKAKDGILHGQFTSALLRSWKGGEFEGDYATFYKALKSSLAQYPGQSPQHVLLGRFDQKYNSQKPFSI